MHVDLIRDLVGELIGELIGDLIGDLVRDSVRDFAGDLVGISKGKEQGPKELLNASDASPSCSSDMPTCKGLHVTIGGESSWRVLYLWFEANGCIVSA